MDNISSLQYFIPELFLTAAIMVIIIVDLILKGEKKIITAYLSVTALVVTIFLSFGQYEYASGSLFQGMIVLDSLAVFFKIITAFSTIIVIFFSIPSFRTRSEYYILLLIVTVGMFLMASVNDLLMIILAMEIVGIVSYVLAGFNKKDIKSNEASLKYVLYGAASTGIMAFGFSYIYGLTGHTNLFEIQQSIIANQPNAMTMFIAVVLVMGGLGYKIAMVPFHFWLPDVYEGAPTPITAFFSIGPKAAGMAVLIRFMTTVIAHPLDYAGTDFIQNLQVHAPMILAILAVLTMTLGNFSALQQKNIKRMMAYSSIAHAGYMLMAFVVFNMQGYEAVLFYLVVYLFMNFGAFWVIESMTPKLGSEEISAYTGLGYRAPYMAVAMAVFMFSLTGLPPLAGFVGKFFLFAAVVNAEWYVLAVLGVLNSVVSLYYYAYVVKVMFLNTVEDDSPIAVGLYDKVLLAVFLVPTIIFGVYWSPIVEFTSRSIGMVSGK